MKAIQATTVAVLCASALLAPATATAQAADAWHFDAAIYLYLPSVDGTTRFGTGGSDATLVVSFLTTGGTSDRTGRPPVLSSKLRFQGTAAFSVPAGGSLCPSLGILNLDLMELLTF